jgi:uncharacterized protein YkwD
MLSFNWIDYLTLAILVFYAYGGYASGFMRASLDLANFVVSFLIGLRFYGFFGAFLTDKFSITHGFSDAIGFFIVTAIAESVASLLIEKFFTFEILIFRGLNKVLGILPGVLSGTILISFVLVVTVSLPISSPIKHTISASYIGNLLLARTQVLERQLNSVFGGAISETISFLTVEPKSNESVALNFRTKDVSADLAAEREMFESVNKERLAGGLKELVFDNELRDISRSHCEDMLKRGYFSHYTPEGFSPFDRMDEAGIAYNSAGENLALSPNTGIAMQGFMNSPGHKANILSSDFGRIGVGVIDGGIYGEMFCQEFTD